MFGDEDWVIDAANDVSSAVKQVVYTDIREHVYNLKSTPAEYAKKQIKRYADLKSSAINLDQQLKDKGFKTAYKFSHEYNVPLIGSDQVIWDAYRLEYFYNLATKSNNIKLGHKAAFYKVLDDAARVSYRYAQYVWKNNPMAQFDYDKRFDVHRDWGFVLDYLLGVGFQFHPNDVYEFIINHNAPGLSQAQYDALYQKQLVFKNWCMDKHNIDTGCLVLCPMHQDKLAKILTGKDTPYFLQKMQSVVRSVFCGRQY